MDTEKIRQKFPFFASQPKAIYFDNACMNLRPQSVIDAMVGYYRDYPACAGRSAHRRAERVTKEVERVREAVAGFIGADQSREIVFVKNTTEAINLVARSFRLDAGDTVIVSDKEHNSNLIPWQVLAKEKKIRLEIVSSAAENTFDLGRFERIMKENPKVKLVALGHVSNLDGATIPAREIVALSHAYGAKVLLDAAQAVGHQRIDVKNIDVDFLAFSGHKMFGPSGTGVLYGKFDLLKRLEPFLVGGNTAAHTTYETHVFLDPPMKFEAGLQDYAGIIGLGAAIDFIGEVGIGNISDHERKLTSFLDGELRKLDGIHIIGPKEPEKRGGITSFWIDGIDSHQLAAALDQSQDIAVRAGQHCVHAWFHGRKIKNALRVSLAVYNTQEEVETFIGQMRKIVSLI